MSSKLIEDINDYVTSSEKCDFCMKEVNYVYAKSPIQYHKSSDKTWCDVCQCYWEAEQNKIKPVFEQCIECQLTEHPVRYYISSCERWCEMCQEIWQDDMYEEYQDEKDQEETDDYKNSKRR